MLRWRPADELLAEDDDDVPPYEREPELLPPGTIEVRLLLRPLVLKRPTHLHDNHGAIWRPAGENAASYGPMPDSAKRQTSDKMTDAKSPSGHQNP